MSHACTDMSYVYVRPVDSAPLAAMGRRVDEASLAALVKRVYGDASGPPILAVPAVFGETFTVYVPGARAPR